MSPRRISTGTQRVGEGTDLFGEALANTGKPETNKDDSVSIDTGRWDREPVVNLQRQWDEWIWDYNENMTADKDELTRDMNLRWRRVWRIEREREPAHKSKPSTSCLSLEEESCKENLGFEVREKVDKQEWAQRMLETWRWCWRRARRCWWWVRESQRWWRWWWENLVEEMCFRVGVWEDWMHIIC